ncbi:MAG: hypothetical protein NXH87_18230 [Rhodobiaceae bacterium]|nr:hypothetical protein RHODOSMS8_01444 [Rhodobiaceae bacterium]MCR9243321.1 hypothetical protein [Rhodobiaceae bacterium]
MTNIDDEIRAVLSSEEMAELETLTGEQGMFDMIGDSFRSKMRYWVAILWIYSFAAWGGAVWSGFRFFQATDVKEMAFWGGLCVVLVIFVALAKIWYWMEVNKNTVVRELKRVELQIAFLAKSVAAQK